MLTFTSAGAVSRPRTVQIRVQRAYPGRIRAGAPVPTRSMDAAEIEQNLRFFTEGQKGPRKRPATTLVLSGVGVVSRPDTPALLALARQLGLERIVLHCGTEDLETLDPSPFADAVDVLVLPVQPGPSGGSIAGTRAVRRCRDAGLPVASNTVLTAAAVPHVEAAARAIASLGAGRHTFTWPFPIAGNSSGQVPGVRAAVRALERAVPILERAGVTVGVKGLPGCYIGGLSRLLWKSANRWYVDADHQCGDAVLFYPEVARFHKDEACRFCRLDGRCDGFFSTYLRRPGFPPLSPLPAEPVEDSQSG